MKIPKFPSLPSLPKVPNCFKSVKYTLAVVNGVFLFTGIFLLIVGLVVLLIYTEYQDLITKKFFTIPAFVIATAAIILLSSILGFYGAISKQFYLIAVYAMLLIVVLVFEIAIVIVAYGLEGDAAAKIQSTMLTSLRLYGTRWDITKMWDDLQTEFQCCGVGGRFDWVSNLIPVSCCHIDYGVVGTFVCETENTYTDGCAEVLGELLSYHAHIIAVSAVVVTCIQIPITAIGGWMAWKSKFEEVELES